MQDQAPTKTLSRYSYSIPLLKHYSNQQDRKPLQRTASNRISNPQSDLDSHHDNK